MRRTTAMILTGLVALVSGRPAAAAQPGGQPPDALSRKAVDEAVFEAMRQAMTEGADLYNRGFKVASAYLFRGALLGVEPLLDHRPELKRAVRRGLDDAGRMPNIDDRAWALHYVAVRVWTDVKPAVAKKPLWDRLGGQPGVRAIVDDWINEALRDGQVNLTRGGRFLTTPQEIDQFKDHLVHLAATVGGGPPHLKYTGRHMRPAHAGLGITDNEFDAFVSCLTIALNKKVAAGKVSPDDVKTILGMISTIKTDVVNVPAAPAAGGVAAGATLWDRLGGQPGVTKIVDDWIDAALKNPQVNFTRGGRFFQNRLAVDTLKQQFVILASTVGGGPLPPYRGPTLKQIHAHLGVKDAEFTAFVGELKLALNRHAVAPADVALILKAVETVRKDVVAPNGGAMPGPAAAAAGPQGDAGGVPPAGPVTADRETSFIGLILRLLGPG